MLTLLGKFKWHKVYPTKLILSVTGQETTSIVSLEPQKLSKFIQKNASRPMFHQVIHLETHCRGNGGIKITPRPLNYCILLVTGLTNPKNRFTLVSGASEAIKI